MAKYTDKEIVEMLQSSNPKMEDAALVFLHQQVYQMTTQFVLKFKGTLEDGEDVLQEALIAFFKLARTHKLPDKLNAEAYLFTICKNKWYRKLRKKPEQVELSESFSSVSIEDVRIKTILEDEQTYLLKILQNQLGEACYSLLVFFYYENRKMKEIAKLMSFGSEQVAKNKKSKCMTKLKNLILEKPDLKKAFQ